jgi:putative redox protein
MDLISVNHRAGTEFVIGVRGHLVTSDMSVKDGGGDAGPSPVELFAGALGACIAMTVAQYCQTHGYGDGDVEVSLTLELVDNPKRVGRIVVDLEVPKSVPEDRREVIRRVAEHCPLHETMRGALEIDIDVVLA